MTAREPVPFEELLAPLVADAGKRLRTKSNSALFTSPALADLENDLLRLLSGLAAQPLQLRFSRERICGTGYPHYVRSMNGGGLRELLAEYATLGTLLPLAVATWVNVNARLMRRLERDSRLLGLAMRVVRIRPSLSDRRQGGQTVAILEFENGRRLVYKPRSMGTERAFAAILAWCNAVQGGEICRAAAVTVRQGYGWQEFIPQLPCETEAGVRRYYERAGALLCILYVLHGTDCHMGNIIASGEYPVLIDVETLFQPLSESSVLATGLLPEPGAEFNISGLGVGHRPATEFRVPRWEHINTDKMTLRYARAAIRPHRNMPVLGSDTVDSGPYLNEVISGFETMYGILAARRTEFLRIVAAHWNHPVRRMLHATSDYFAVLNESLQPRFLRDEEQRRHQVGRALESLGMSTGDGESLLALDIPHSYSAPDKSGVRATILAMSEADLARQCSLIRVSWMDAVLAKAEHFRERMKLPQRDGLTIVPHF